MSHDDERAARQQLHGELGSLEIPPPPVIAVTQRGKAIRARRRALAGGLAAAVAAALLAARFIGAPGPAPGTVTLNPPSPRAPGGVFASGTANGKPWRLAVRNIAAGPGTRWCLPAVMFNGGNGDVLVKTGPGVPSFGNPAFLSHIPGFPGVGAVFTQVTPEVTRLAATFPGERRLTARPVRASACGIRFYLAGFAFAMREAGASALGTYTASGFDEGLDVDFRMAAMKVHPGIWVDWDMSYADLAATKAATTIGAGTIAGQPWRIRAALGPYGQCYTATLRGHGGHGHSHECVPVAAPPRTIALSWVPVPGATMELTGYAGLVSPRAREFAVTFGNGTTDIVHPVNVAGRAYIAFVVPPGSQVIEASLQFASQTTTITALPPAR